MTSWCVVTAVLGLSALSDSGHLPTVTLTVVSLLMMAAYADSSDRMLTRKRFCIRAFVDVVCVCLVAGPVLIINLVAEPFHRGFFCDDQSLMHPLLGDTVPTWLLAVVGLGLPVVSVLLVECLLQRTTRCCVLVPTEIPPVPKTCVECCYRTIIIFFFGSAITQLLTEIGKNSIGRLRPHFLDVCRPENLPANCSGLYITEDLCTGTDTAALKEARLSFPSGHASMSMYSATFLMVYLQARLVCSQAKLLRPVLQVGVLVMGFFTCLSRVSDYKHHWSDVLSGGLLGIIVCYLIIVFLSDFHHLLVGRSRSTLSTSRKERLPMFRKDNTSTSSDMPSGSGQDTIQVHVENQKL